MEKKGVGEPERERGPGAGRSFLERLGGAWESWAHEPLRPARQIGRLRAYLLFLLIRYGALRLAEAFAFDPGSHLDRETGMLSIPGENSRRVFLPLVAMRPIRVILALGQSGEKDFLRMDPGLARRIFYTVAREAGIDPSLCGPRALRHARGVELLAMHMPLAEVRNYLGLRRPAQLRAFLKFASAAAGAGPGPAFPRKGPNSFICLIEEVAPLFQSAMISLKTFSGLPFRALCPLRLYMKLEPEPGEVLRVEVNPDQIFLVSKKASAAIANSLTCKIDSVYTDQTGGLAHLTFSSGEALVARLDACGLSNFKADKGMEVLACFPASALSLYPL